MEDIFGGRESRSSTKAATEKSAQSAGARKATKAAKRAARAAPARAAPVEPAAAPAPKPRATKAAKPAKAPKAKPAKKSGKAVRTTTKRHRKPKRSFKGYFAKVLKSLKKDVGISKRGMEVVNSMVLEALDKMVVEVQNLLQMTGKKTVSSREIQTAVRVIFPGELAKHAVSEATKAVTMYSARK